MSVQAITWAYRQRPGSALDKFLLVTLANYADERGWCFPSQTTLAADMAVDVRSIRRHLASLEAAGLLTRRSRRLKSGRRTSDLLCLDLAAASHRTECPVEGPATGQTGPAKRTDCPLVSDSEEIGASDGDEREKGHPDGAQPADTVSAEPFEPSMNQTRARAAGGEREKNQPARQGNRDDRVCARWRRHEAELVRLVGRDDFGKWFRDVTPHEDDGAVLVLAATPFVAARVQGNWSAELRQVFGEVRFTTPKYAAPKAARRRKTP